MKKIFLISLVFHCCMVAAQSKKLKGTAEIRALINVANLKETDGTRSETYSSIARPNIGLIGHVPISQHCWITPGVFYNGLGTTVENSANLLLNYVSIPLYFKYVVGSNGILELYAGPQFGLLIDARGRNPQSGGTSTDIKTFFLNTDISGVVGISVVPVKKSPLVVIAQYMKGFTNIADRNRTPSQPGAEVSLKNNAFGFGIGYRF